MTKLKHIAITKALQTEICRARDVEKQYSEAWNYFQNERALIGAANNRDQNWTLEDVKYYAETSLEILGRGASKIAYGTKNLAISFMKTDACECLGNQVIKQKDAWEKIKHTEDYIYFNPVISYGGHRGDKLSNMDKRSMYASFIVSPRAILTEDKLETVKEAFRLNRVNELIIQQQADAYLIRLQQAAERFNIYDLHSGNIGIIYDYDLREYRAVIIDYAL